MNAEATPRPIAVTGATGYIGARLVPRLLAAGHRVRCLVRSPKKLADRPFANDPRVEIVACDLADAAATTAALIGCRAAYYLVHSMLAAGDDYAETDLRLARTFAWSAAAAAIDRIVYLGGLGETGAGLSEHLSSRREVERELAGGRVPVTTLRAAMILGAGSASFEILRYLVERLPVMITPRWVATRCQPIAVADVLRYLVTCLDVPATAGQTLDIGGPDIVTYREIIQATARAAGLWRRWIVPVPVLTPRLSSLWIHLVTPISARIARPLAEGLKNEVVCRDDRARRLMPGLLHGVEAAIGQAVADQRAGTVASRWSDAGVMPGDPDWAGGKVFLDPRAIEIDAEPAAVHRAVCRVGGGHGWYAADWLWRLRGWFDRLVGGPGLRRGRRDAERVGYGEALDFWRVTDVVPGRRLELTAEMKLPGIATLTFEIEPLGDGHRSRLLQTARFKPRGLLGLCYWYAVLPLHGIVFRGMQRGIRATAERAAAQRSSSRQRADSASRSLAGAARQNASSRT
ncbi:MAG: SDR family oxidoreductase, partial [Planctomycetes bacterium]|nr:SDR family oxidoreductase [Planctomycetota bacterium]